MAGGLTSAPVNTVPTEVIRLPGGGIYAFDGAIEVGDEDGGPLTVTLEAGSDYASLAIDSAFIDLIVVGDNGDSRIELQGSIAELNAALATLVFETDGGSSDTLRIETFDGERTDSDLIYIDTNDYSEGPPAPEAPVNNVPTETLRISPDGTYAFDGNLSISDADSDYVSVTLTAGGGNLSVDYDPENPELSVQGNNTGEIELEGRIEDVNAALASLEFQHDSELGGGGFDHIDITTLDWNGEGYDYADSDRIHFNVAELSAEEPDVILFRDTRGDDTFEPASGVIASTANDPIFTLAGGEPSCLLPGYDQRLVGAYGTLFLNSQTGAYTFLPDDDAIEGLKSRQGETFLVEIADGEDTTSVDIAIDAKGVNDRPTLDASRETAVFTDTSADDSFSPATGQLTGADRDSCASLAYGITGGVPAGIESYEVKKTGAYGTLYVNIYSGAYRYEPNEGAIEALKSNASESFTLTVTDDDGLTTGKTFTVQARGANDAPEASITSGSASYTDTVSDNAFAVARGRLIGADRDLGDALSYEIAGGSASSARTGFDVAKTGDYGTLFLNSGTGAYLFVPSDAAIEGLKGPADEAFTLRVRDESGATASETFTIDLAGANDRPEGRDDSYSVDAGGTLRVARLAGILRNDSDRDDAALDAVLVDGPRNGTLTLNANGSFVYTPDSDFSRSGGTDSFTYNASDGSLGSGPTRVTITVEPGSRPPVAADNDVAVAEDRTSLAERVVTGNVLANDSDPDAGDSLHVAALAGVSLGAARVLEGRYGTLTLRADGSYSYAFSNTDALIAGETGIERFAYTIADGEGRTDTAFLTFTIDGADLKLTTSGTLVAHRGGDEITGMSGADRLAGRRGDDLLKGEGGNDMLWGEDGDDRILGGLGDDQGIGGAGDDSIALGDGDDRGWGEAGNDILRGEDGNDRLDGGIGDDSIDLGFGDDRGWGSLGNDVILGGAGADWLNAGAGADSLAGGTGDDELWGEADSDVLDGGLGNDRMSAGSGNDTILMGPGDDTAWGGTGADRFAFSAGFGDDVIKDFGAGDRIVFDGVFASFAAVQSAMRVNGGNIVIDGPNGNTITVENVTRLDSGDFIFI